MFAAITCGGLPSVLNTIVNTTGDEVGHIAVLSCAEGYKLTSGSILRCNSSGNWEGEDILCESKCKIKVWSQHWL